MYRNIKIELYTSNGQKESISNMISYGTGFGVPMFIYNIEGKLLDYGIESVVDYITKLYNKKMILRGLYNYLADDEYGRYLICLKDDLDNRSFLRIDFDE